MVDIHDRRPVVLSAEHAREWVDPDTSALRAEELARGVLSGGWELRLVSGWQGGGQRAESGG